MKKVYVVTLEGKDLNDTFKEMENIENLWNTLLKPLNVSVTIEESK